MSNPSKLASYSTCEISDALIKLGVPNGGYIPDINMVSPLPYSHLRICGPAYTVRMVLSSSVDTPKLSSHFLDNAPEGSIIFIQAPAQAKNAVWGGLMSAGAQSRGAIGVIISGRCRDLAEHRSLGFPVFASGHSILGQSPFTRPSEINVGLIIPSQGDFEVGSEQALFPLASVSPGDWLIADEDGVTCVPKDLEEAVLEVAEKGRQVDELCMRDIKAGKGVQASFKEHRGK